MVSSVNLNGATMTDGSGKAASLSLTGIAQGSPQIDTTPPTVSSATATAGDYNAGQTLTLTLRHERGSKRHWLADARPQRWRHRNLCQRLRIQHAGVQLHGWRRAEHLRAASDGVAGAIADLAGNALSTAGLPETFTAASLAAPRRQRFLRSQSHRRAATSMPARPSR